MSVVLVTGGTGALGRATVSALSAAGKNVRVLSRRAGSESRRVVGDSPDGTGLRRFLEDSRFAVERITFEEHLEWAPAAGPG